MNPTLLHLQALEETKMNQVRIITELEKEKKKMQDDVQKLRDAKVKHTSTLRDFVLFLRKYLFLSCYDTFYFIFPAKSRKGERGV